MSAAANKRQTGDLGEDAVCAYLERQGAEILCRNFTVRGGEIDIIAQQGEYLLFVEVKTRRPGSLVSGAAAVDARKQRLIIRTAEQYLLKYPSDLQPRFDVAETECSGGMIRHITYLEGAFDATGV
ncbi:MAG: YraN family protein [Oscillospiraceae bacterium]|nr:YraN family protein [Oscillospiraceae bacterium]